MFNEEPDDVHNEWEYYAEDEHSKDVSVDLLCVEHDVEGSGTDGHIDEVFSFEHDEDGQDGVGPQEVPG